jgi:excisionase family DNA binding protein
MKMSSYEPPEEAGSRGPIELLTIPEVAKLLKISITGVRRLYIGRHIPFIKVGGSVRFAKSDILEYLKKERIEAMR